LKITTYKCQFTGLRPLMFDRYAGDNNTQLPIPEKMYLTSDGHLIVPAVNIFSLLCAENTKSVCKQMFGKAGRKVALGISSYVSVEPFEIPLTANGVPIQFSGFNDQISIHTSVARVKGGVPNPKTRPLLHLPWELEFDVQYQQNSECTLENLRQALSMGGVLGLGTFRPYFGRYELTRFEQA
jgi:hypothetical protein